MNRILTFSDLNEADRCLVEAAQEASVNAYAPYSGFAVGAAVRTKTKEGHIYTGANLENSSYGLSICAEASVLAVANANGEFNIETIAVAGHKFTQPQDSSLIVMPCGRCRQLIFEASQVSKVDVRVLSCNGELSQIAVSTIAQLLPTAFGPENLGMDETWLGMRVELQSSVTRLSTVTRKASA